MADLNHHNLEKKDELEYGNNYLPYSNIERQKIEMWLHAIGRKLKGVGP